MGICASCLGLNRGPRSDPSESSQLLVDPYQPHYGAINPNGGYLAPQPDPEDIKREREALERLCAKTSDKLIDVSQPTHVDEAAKLNGDYSQLFAKKFPPVHPGPSSQTASNPDEEESAWLHNVMASDRAVSHNWNSVQQSKSGALTMQYGDGGTSER